MYMHKSFRVIPLKATGIPPHYLHSFYNASADFQLDWIKIDDNQPVQLCALIELCFPNLEKIFLFSGILGSYVPGIIHGVSPPFPTIKYEMVHLEGKGRFLYPALIADVVDYILEPSYVVSVNGGTYDFILKDTRAMTQARFLVVPMQYLLRDGYASMNFTEQLQSTAIHTDSTTRRFLNETKPGRKVMYNELIKTLQRNGDTEYDGTILQDLFQHRRLDDEDEDEDEDD